MTGTEKRWYVVQTRPHAESKAVWHLNRQGFETYLPRYRRRQRHARRIENVASPLFPRYLFVAVDMATQRWRSIHSTIGVTRLVCDGNTPAPVACQIVGDLKGREDKEGFVQLGRKPRFAPGTPVRILDGVFTDCLGLFEDMTGDERVTVLLELLGRKVRVVLDDLSVAAA
ncbi:MAG: transcription termination/antitermination NusG family protein [Xanthobacteraceae bacterium]